MLEKVVYITNSISPYNFGFLRNRSTLQQLLVFFNNIFSSLGLQADVVYLDFRKAFDSVAHRTSELICKLWKFGITGNLWSWLPVSSQKDCILLQNDLNTLSELCNTLNLFLNEDKCSVVRFTTSHYPYLWTTT